MQVTIFHFLFSCIYRKVISFYAFENNYTLQLNFVLKRLTIDELGSCEIPSI